MEFRVIVLIDTWWNVNPLPAALVHSNPPF